MNDCVEVTVDAGVADVCMTKPPVNALTPRELTNVAATIRALGGDADVRVLLLRSSTRGFCAGIDIRQLAEDPRSIADVNRAAFDAFAAIHHCPAPVVSAVHGFALGAGLAMVGASDVVFAAEGTKFGLPEINVGMLGGASHALRLLPMHKVRSMYFTGEPISAAEMYRLGAVEEVLPETGLFDRAMEYAKLIAQKEPRCLRFAKEALNGIEPGDLEMTYRYEQGFTFELAHLPEGQGARDAFQRGS